MKFEVYPATTRGQEENPQRTPPTSNVPSLTQTLHLNLEVRFPSTLRKIVWCRQCCICITIKIRSCKLYKHKNNRLLRPPPACDMIPIVIEKLQLVPLTGDVPRTRDSSQAIKMLRSLSGSILRPIYIKGTAVETPFFVSFLSAGMILSLSRVLDENVFDPLFQSYATDLEKQMADSATDLKYFGGIDGILRTTKVVCFLASPLFFLLTVKKLISGSFPLLAIAYGIVGLDFLRVSYNCYVKNYCAVGLRRCGR